jgi:hypothetical protein
MVEGSLDRRRACFSRAMLFAAFVVAFRDMATKIYELISLEFNLIIEFSIRARGFPIISLTSRATAISRNARCSGSCENDACVSRVVFFVSSIPYALLDRQLPRPLRR